LLAETPSKRSTPEKKSVGVEAAWKRETEALVNRKLLHAEVQALEKWEEVWGRSREEKKRRK
jgi:hypothetical protein